MGRAKPQAAQAPGPCDVCKHTEDEHTWDSPATGLRHVSRCWHQERLSRKGDEAEVRYRRCSCSIYMFGWKDLMRGRVSSQEEQ
jgi:hypothetical protein